MLFSAIFISSIFQEEIQVAWWANVLYNKKMNPLQGSSNFSHSSDRTKEWVKEDKETWCLVLEEVTLQFRFYLLKFVPHCLAKNMTKHLNCFWMCNRQKRIKLKKLYFHSSNQNLRCVNKRHEYWCWYWWGSTNFGLCTAKT